VFDLGGTLIEYAGEHDSWPDLEGPGLLAAHNYLHAQGLQLPAIEPFTLAGFNLLPKRWRLATSGERNLTVPSFLAEILENLGAEVPSDHLLSQAAKDYESAVCQGAKPIPNSLTVLSALRAKGYKIGLISNTMFSGESHKADIKRFGMEDCFDSTLFSADLNEWKPTVAPFRRILHDLEVDAGQAVFIGDDPAADVIGGKQAGMKAIYFVSSNRFSVPDGASPDATIHSLLELEEEVRRLDNSNRHATLNST
jgi:putative hydrolase of the HAD superfamily